MTYSANESEHSNPTKKAKDHTTPTLSGILQNLTPDERRVIDVIIKSRGEQHVIENWKYIKNQLPYYASIS